MEIICASLNWKIFTENSPWFILLCLLLGVIYAAVLYYREKKNEFPVGMKAASAFLRTLSVSLIAFMLLSPFIRNIQRIREDPVIILAQDNSSSILANVDSAFYREEYLAGLDDLAREASSVGEVSRFIFGAGSSRLENDEDFSEAVKYNDQQTDLSGLIEDLSLIYANRNVGALIIASDGIYNTGSNPVYSLRSWPFPVYTIALGDTSQRRDLIISRVNYNRTVFLNNQFPVEMDIHAHDCQGERTTARIYSGDQLLFSQELSIDGPNWDHSLKTVLDARELGLKRLRITLDPVSGELSRQNNSREIFLEVIEARFRILLLARAPHPDISALRQAILSNDNYEVAYQSANEATGPVDQYNLVILHDLPSQELPVKQLLEEMEEKQVPGLFIIGSQSDLGRFNSLRTGLNIIASKKLSGEAIPELNDDFMLFSLTGETKNAIREFPPLVSPVGDFQSAQGLNVLMKQRIGAISTSRPLVGFSETSGRRLGVIAGEGIWKWRLMDYSHSQDHRAFNELVNKVVQYLSVREVKKNLRLYHQNNFKENEKVMFDAEVYDEAYELTTVPDLEIRITGEDSAEYPFIFTRTASAYRLDAGILPPGNYRYQAFAKSPERSYEASGQFSISRIDMELSQTMADQGLMYSLAKAGDGLMVTPDDISQLLTALKDRDDIRPVIYSRKKYSELIDYAWVLGLIIFLASLEWFMRKRAGGY